MNRLVRQQGVTGRKAAIAVLVAAMAGGVVLRSLADRGARAVEIACDENVARINTAIEQWHFDHGRWPAEDLADIRRDPAYFPNGIPRCPVTGEPYRMDLQTHRVARHRHGEPTRHETK